MYNTLDYLNYLDKIDIQIPLFNNNNNLVNIHNLYNFTRNIYDSIDDKSLILQKYNLETISKHNKEIDSALFSLLVYLNDNNLLSTYLNDYSLSEKDEFNTILKNKKYSKCSEWLNVKGKSINRTIYNLISNKDPIIPSHYQSIFNSIDNDIYCGYLSLEIQKEIEHKLKYKHNYIYTYHHNNKIIDIRLCICSKSNTIKKTWLYEILKRIIFITLLSNNFKNHNTDKIIVNMTILLTSKEKQLTYNHKKDTIVLGSNEINSALATKYRNIDNTINYNKSNIVLYRSEELNKLLLHELIHYFEIDFNTINSDFLYNIININKKNKILINESYTEILACILNSFLTTFRYNLSLDMALDMINYELKFNLLQCAKILKYYKFKNAFQLLNDNNVNNTEHSINQETSVLSYFFIKTALLFNFDLFLEFINKNTDYLVKNNKNIKDNYIDLVKSSITNRYFLDTLTQFMLVNSDNNLRMTCIELY